MIDLGLIATYLPQLLAALGLTGAAAGSRWVDEGDRALVQRFGKAVRVKWGAKKGQYRVLGPGFNIIVPFIDKTKRTHVRQNVMNMGDEEVTLSDSTVFTVDGVLVFRVDDTDAALYKALFEVDDLRHAIKLYCIGVMREALRSKSYEELISGDTDALSRELTELVTPQLTEWGLVVKSFSLGDLSPYGQTLGMIQAPAAAKLRLKALKDVTKGLKELGLDHPSVIAAVIGIPVSVAVNDAPDTSSPQVAPQPKRSDEDD